MAISRADTETPRQSRGRGANFSTRVFNPVQFRFENYRYGRIPILTIPHRWALPQKVHRHVTPGEEEGLGWWIYPFLRQPRSRFFVGSLLRMTVLRQDSIEGEAICTLPLDGRKLEWGCSRIRRFQSDSPLPNPLGVGPAGGCPITSLYNAVCHGLVHGCLLEVLLGYD